MRATPVPFFDLSRHTKVLLIMDVVESVRLMETDQDDFVQRWLGLVQEVEHLLLPEHGGRVVKSLGDGLMIEFADAQGCAQTALGLQHLVHSRNENLPGHQHIHLRVGAHLAQYVAGEHDIYGADVNLTSRITSLARPGEIIFSAELRDCISVGLTTNFEDLGDCYLKHVERPVRIYRLGEPGPRPVKAHESALAL